LHVPEPEGVEQGLLVQHLISLEPGQRFDVTEPEQQPAEVETQTLRRESIIPKFTEVDIPSDAADATSGTV
jgi:hypothetical protein